MNNVALLAGNEAYSQMPLLSPLKIFSELTIQFLNSFAKNLIRHPLAKKHTDIISLGFFCREANLLSLQEKYVRSGSLCVGRGVTFHIAPSNVPINFAYSLVAGLLAGNSCIVRVSSKDFDQVDIVCEALSTALLDPEFQELRKRISVVRYGHSDEINEFFTSLCDVRIIWGGDQTIADIRKAPLPSRSFDITFADRYSACIIDALGYLAIQDKNKVAQNFFNDTYLFDQNACSSPKLMYWVGNTADVKEAKNIFWAELMDVLLKRSYVDQASSVMNKYLVACKAAIDFSQVHLQNKSENIISRIELSELPMDLSNYACGGGSFFEYADLSLDKLAKIVTRKFQTITYIGLSGEDIANDLLNKGVVGIDRIVPSGAATNFDLTWDGYNLIGQMSRVISYY